MRPNTNHSLSDRLMRASIKSLTDEHLLIAICADSPNSSDITCEVRGINGNIKKQIGAVAQILRDFPEQIMYGCQDNLDINRLIKLIHRLPEDSRINILIRLQNIIQKTIHTAPGGQSGIKEGQNENQNSKNFP